MSVIQPPHSAEAEQSLLGAILGDNRNWLAASRHMRPDMVYGSANREAIERAAAEISSGRAIDVVSLSDFVTEADIRYIGECQRSCPSFAPSSVEAWAKIIADRYRRRQLLAASYSIGDKALKAASASDAIAESRRALDAVEDAAVGGGPRSPESYMSDWLDSVKWRRDNPGAMRGLATGLERLDDRWGGLCAPDLIILAARPSMGKTALAVNIGEEVASGGKQVLMFSMEMSASQLIDRRVSAVGGINLKQLRDQNLDGDELTRMVSASASLRDRPFYIDDRSALPIDEIHATCDAHKARNGLGLVIVDYLGLATKPGAESRIHEVRAISSGLKKIAKDLNIPVLALAQLNRRCEERADKRPLLSDLRESGDIEQDADIVSFLYRESYYEKEAVGWHGVAEIITAKNRNGEVGTDYVAEQLNYSRFRNLYGWTKPERKKSRGPNL